MGGAFKKILSSYAVNAGHMSKEAYNRVNGFDEGKQSTKKQKTKMVLKFTEEQIQDVMNTFSDLYGSSHTKQFTIDQNFINNINVVEEDVKNYLPLLGYKLQVISDGDHRNDGQMVDYTFKFTSPSGNVTEIETEMCLMVGFNYGEDIEIN